MALPNVSIAFNDWFQPIIFGVVVETNIDYELQETVTNVSTMGVVQPFSAKTAKILPDGVRFWDYLQVHCLPDLDLEINSYVFYKDKKYKVEGKLDYSEYGYVEYHIRETFADSSNG